MLRYHCAVFLLLLLSPLPSSAKNSLRSGETLTGNATLVSAGQIFEFGFFPSSSGRYYLGIWYHNITPQVVVWVANRDAPFANNSAQISLSDDANLVVVHGASGTAWSTGLASSWGGNFSATLGDDGDLVLRRDGESGGTARWRSFDQPTDTLLSGMEIYIDKTTGDGPRFWSWRAEGDPASGNYSLGLDRRFAQQLVILDGSGRMTWRSGLFIGGGFNGASRMRPLNQYGFHLANDVQDPNRITFGFTYMNQTRMRFVLLPNGTETTYVHDGSRWNNIWQQPVTKCEFYGHCGENAVCDDSSEPRCACLRGFDPRSPEEWGSGNWARGCSRRTPLGNGSAGGEADVFVAMEKMKFPDAAEWDSVATDAVGCKRNCAGNASCTAYAYEASGGCFRWSGVLLDMFRFADGSNGGELFVRLAASELDNENKVNIVVIIVPVVAGLLLLACIFLYWKYKSRIKGLWTNGRVDTVATEAPTSGEQHEHAIAVSEVDDIIHSDRKPFELPMFSLELLQSATDNFGDENELGRGGFGHVYKGKFPWGEEIAVKRLSANSGQGQEEFKNEMTLIAKLQHVNLVRLLGCCIQGEEKMLIYEYMPNKSLDAFIFDAEKQALLDWRARFNIIEGVARGLLYLHRDSRLRIVHRDLKASNILLDQDMNPKISDFGMARIFYSNQNHENTTRVVGTFGYMSPEYAMEGLFSVKSDVYSFGVLLLEIISGIKNTKCRTEEYQNLLGYAWKLWDEGQAMELVDPSIRGSCNRDEVLRCIHLALLCAQDRANDRPTMSSVVIMLGTEATIHVDPRRPTFSSGGEGGGNLTWKDGFSTNGLTVTELDPR